jgi:hypothetical protein
MGRVAAFPAVEVVWVMGCALPEGADAINEATLALAGFDLVAPPLCVTANLSPRGPTSASSRPRCRRAEGSHGSATGALIASLIAGGQPIDALDREAAAIRSWSASGAARMT